MSEEFFGVEEPAALSMGVIVGGWSPHTSEWKVALQGLMRRVESASEGASSPLSVNVIFQVPGNNITPDFEGVRTGYFSKKKMWLIVQAALPETPHEENIDADLRDRLREAIAEAEAWAKRRRSPTTYQRCIGSWTSCSGRGVRLTRRDPRPYRSGTNESRGGRH